MESCSADTLLRDARWLRRLTRELVHDPAFADDLCQETMVAALRSPTGGNRHWLTQVARNLAISFLRREQASAAGRAHSRVRPGRSRDQ